MAIARPIHNLTHTVSNDTHRRRAHRLLDSHASIPSGAGKQRSTQMATETCVLETVRHESRDVAPVTTASNTRCDRRTMCTHSSQRLVIPQTATPHSSIRFCSHLSTLVAPLSLPALVLPDIFLLFLLPALLTSRWLPPPRCSSWCWHCWRGCCRRPPLSLLVHGPSATSAPSTTGSTLSAAPRPSPRRPSPSATPTATASPAPTACCPTPRSASGTCPPPRPAPSV